MGVWLSGEEEGRGEEEGEVSKEKDQEERETQSFSNNCKLFSGLLG